MEIELKYLVDEPAKADQLFADPIITEIQDDKEEEVIPMHAVYYDTPDRRLLAREMAMRIRKEGERFIGTLKWGGHSEDGLHRREEVNLPIPENQLAEGVSVELFEPCDQYETLKELVGDQKLEPLVEMEFQRRQIRLDTGDSISVFSVDQGAIRGNGKEVPISEIEIELFSGEEEDIVALGKRISEKYDLKPGVKSKFERGLALL